MDFAVDAVTVDSYTTLVDVGAGEGVLRDHVDDPAAVSRLWRSRTMAYSVIANDIDAYRPFSELLDLGLRYALEVHGHDLSGRERERIREAVYGEHLSAFDDVRPGLARVSDAGYPVYVLSNGDPGMLSRLVEAADLGDVVEGTISADEVRVYKPDPGIYRHGAARTGAPIDRVLHVSGGSMRDVWGAKHAGMRAAWLSRPEKPHPREHLGPEPDIVVSGFHDLADRLD